MEDCSIELWEQPAKKVKFRMEVHGHRCQSKELLVGRNSTEEGRIFPLVKVICGSQGTRIRESLRRDLFVRMSLVDIRSCSTRIVEHYHQLVDCNGSSQTSQTKARSITKKLTGMDDRVEFDNLGIVKTLEKDKVEEVTERMLERRQEAGDTLGTWDRQDIRDNATRQAKETSPFRLKLMFESFLRDERGVVVKVAPDVFSDEIVDITNTTTGELAVRKVNLAHDTAMGGAEMMMFTGGGKPECKVNHARSFFQAEFFQLDPQDPYEERKVWSNVVDVREEDLHTVGQFLGGLSFLIPPYRDPNIAVATQNVYCQIIKRNKAKIDQIQAKSDPLYFTYTPQAKNLQRTFLKRPMPNILQTYKNVHGCTPKNIPFVPTFNPDIPTKMPKGPTMGDILYPVVQPPEQPQQRAPSVIVQQPSRTQQRASSLQDTIKEIQDNPQITQMFPYQDTKPTLSPLYNPEAPFSPSQIGGLSLGSPNPPSSQTFSPSQMGGMTLSSTNPTSSQAFSPAQMGGLTLSSHNSILSQNIPSSSQMGRITLTSPNPLSSQNIPSPSPSGGTYSVNTSAQSPLYMVSSPTSSININPSTSFMSMNSSTTLLVDPHGLGNAPSTPANSPRMDSNSIILNLGADLGSIDFGDLLNDASNQLSGIQPDSERFEDIFMHEIIATDGETKENIPENNTNTTEIKEKKINPKSQKKLKEKSNENENADIEEKLDFQKEHEIIATDGETKENLPENNTNTTEIKEKQINPKSQGKLKDKSNKNENAVTDENLDFLCSFQKEHKIKAKNVEDQKENDLTESIGNLKLN